MTMDAEERFLGYAAAQLAAVAVLGGLAAAMTLFGPFSFHDRLAPEYSDQAAVLTHQLLWAFLITVGVLYVVVPIAVAGYRISRGRRLGVEAAWAAVALVGLPALLWTPLLLDGYDPARRRLGAGILLLGGLGALVVGYLSVSDRVDDDAWRPVPWSFGNVALTVVFVLAFALAGFVGGGLAGGMVEQRYLGAVQVSFATDYDGTSDGRGVLTIRHEGGETVAAEHLIIRGDGITAVEGANQSSAGPWQGEATGESDWDGGASAVVRGDSVTVGVESGCVVRVVYQRYRSHTVEKYTCGQSEPAG